MSNNTNSRFPAQNQELSVEEQIDAATEAFLKSRLIQEYDDLQRIKFARDRDKEIDLQIKVKKLQLEVFGFSTEKLDLHEPI